MHLTNQTNAGKGTTQDVISATRQEKIYLKSL